MKSGALTQSQVIASRRDQRFEEQAGEGCCRCSFRCGLRRDQEERKLQARRHVELEVEEEARHSSEEGHQPIHQGALRLQGKASIKDGEGTCHEEIEGGFELNFQMICTPRKLWWAVSLSFLCNPLYRLLCCSPLVAQCVISKKK